MKMRSWAVLVVVGAAAAGATVWSTSARAETERASRVAASEIAAELTQRTEDIAFYESRIAGDPQGAIDRTKVGALYLQRARELNDYQDYLRAEEAARGSLALRTARNSAAYAVLASALLAQHRFTEARDAARQLVEAEPTVDAYQSLLGETCLETGDMACARDAFARISATGRASLSVAPRLARWAETRGDTADARRVFRRALSAVQHRPDMPREQAAWFHLRAADLELRQGRAQQAEKTLTAGLLRSPADHRLLAAMARLRAVQHRWSDAIEYGDRAIAITLDPATLGIISDAYRALGDTVKAAEYFGAMEVAVGQQPGAYHRAWSLFLLDHEVRIPEVLAAAQSEIVTRPDIYGFDLLAWALHKSGRQDEAREAIRSALATGTQDAMMLYHAGMIERAAGQPGAAQGYLRRALAVSRWFDYAAPDSARAVLSALPQSALPQSALPQTVSSSERR